LFAYTGGLEKQKELRLIKIEASLLSTRYALIVILAVHLSFVSRALLGQSSATSTGPGRDTECKSVSISIAGSRSNLLEREAEILASQIREHSGIKSTFNKQADCSVELSVQDGIGSDGFRIEHSAHGRVRIVGNDERGLLYGIGKFLRSNIYHRGSFTTGTWTGTSVPDNPVRGIYFATHFHNFYQEAPTQEINRYVEDLALWGYNTVEVWFDMHQFNGIQDPAAQAMIERLNLILSAAKGLGLDTGLIIIANEAYADSPVALRADWTAGHDGYFKEPQGHYHVELCPNKPGARSLMLKWREDTFRAFQGAAVDYITIWPYDTGGCTNTECKPWGANGFLTMAKPIAEMARRYFPGSKIILSTWYFDHFTSGEWDGLEEKFKRQRPQWVDYIMADETGGLQRYVGNPRKHQVPGGFPLVSFPEISMWGADPWGGFGANPLPLHHQEVWSMGRAVIAGGFPYSEGIFDDLNKVLYAQFFWKKDLPASSIVDEYVAYNFSPEVVIPMRKAIAIMERDYPRHAENIKAESGLVRFVFDQGPSSGFRYRSTTHPVEPFDQGKGAAEEFDLVRQAEAHLSPQVRSSWRWRIFYLRAVIDDQLAKNDFRVSDRCEQAFQELVTIYYAQKAVWAVSPPTRLAIERYRRARTRVSELGALTYEEPVAVNPTAKH
jgi:Glycosyl hydrolase family 67 N-terminus